MCTCKMVLLRSQNERDDDEKESCDDEGRERGGLRERERDYKLDKGIERNFIVRDALGYLSMVSQLCSSRANLPRTNTGPGPPYARKSSRT